MRLDLEPKDDLLREWWEAASLLVSFLIPSLLYIKNIVSSCDSERLFLEVLDDAALSESFKRSG